MWDGTTGSRAQLWVAHGPTGTRSASASMLPLRERGDPRVSTGRFDLGE